ncbi:MAG TPA: hypothetical protein EYQ50_27545 [Verrucomicrobiales bacterium]|nr:hypothetical protein [Verrucomicrobiales bacterium]HIL69729.1 hypothetical protein [Verrucomicrobiota bacterium]
MAYRIFRIGHHQELETSEILNQFLNSQIILSVEKRFVECGMDSFWSFCVDYDPKKLPEKGKPPGPRTDWKEVLDEPTFAKFALLRNLRNKKAEAKAIPSYTIFTNEQLAGLAKLKEPTLAAMNEIPGIGDAKIKNYGEDFLKALTAGDPTEDKTDDA